MKSCYLAILISLSVRVHDDNLLQLDDATFPAFNFF